MRNMLLASASLSVFVISPLHAATVGWGAAQNITGDSDVSTIGAPVYAYAVGSSSAATVNGVNFAAFPISSDSGPVTVGNVTVQETDGPLSSYPLGGSTSAPFTSLSSGYQALLNNFPSASVVEAVQVTMGGLTPGDSYSVQAWANGSAIANNLVVSLDGRQSLAVDTTDAAGGLGQYSIGTFVADSSSQSFQVSGASGDLFVYGTVPLLNGFQLRETSAVPEPASLSTVFLGVPMLIKRRTLRK